MIQKNNQSRTTFSCPEFQQLRLFDLQPTDDSLLYQDLISRNKYPGITTILNATWVPNGRKSRSKTVSKREAEWAAQNNRTVGIGFHKYMENCLHGKAVDDFSNLTKALGQSVQKTGLLDSLNFNHVVERFIPWDGRYPYATKLDWFGLIKSKPAIIEWTWRYERVSELSELGDKLLQVTAQGKACRDFFFTSPVEQALIVVAHPVGEASVFTIERDRLEKCWKDQLLPRLRRFYGKSFFDVG